MVKLQGNCVTNSGLGASDMELNTCFWSEFDTEHEDTVKRFKDSSNHEFLEGKITFNKWMKLYKKYK